MPGAPAGPAQMAARTGQTHLSLRVHQAKTPGRQMAGQDRKPLLGREEGVGMRLRETVLEITATEDDPRAQGTAKQM